MAHCRSPAKARVYLHAEVVLKVFVNFVFFVSFVMNDIYRELFGTGIASAFHTSTGPRLSFSSSG